MSIKKRRILRWFRIRGNNLKKVYLEKVFCQKLVQVSSREEAKLQFCTLLSPITFLLANFLHFSQQIPNQRKILSCFDTHISFFLSFFHNRCTLIPVQNEMHEAIGRAFTFDLFFLLTMYCTLEYSHAFTDIYRNTVRKLHNRTKY